MNKLLYRIFDFEATGIPFREEDKPVSVVEAACIDIDGKTLEVVDRYQTLVKPMSETNGMGIEARALHHLTWEECIENGVEWSEVCDRLSQKEDDQLIVYVAHNAKYEQFFFNPEKSLWIDTYKTAMVLYPDSPNHKNGVLKYYLDIENAERHHPEHRSLPDCEVSFDILKRMLRDSTAKELITISKEPLFLTKMPYGKHRGQLFEDLPLDYLNWLLSQKDIDESIEYAILRTLDSKGLLEEN